MPPLPLRLGQPSPSPSPSPSPPLTLHPPQENYRWPGHSGCPPCKENTAGNTDPCDATKCKEAALATIVNTCTRSNGIWRREMGLNMVMIDKQGMLLHYPKWSASNQVGLPNGNNEAFMNDGEWFIEFIGDSSSPEAKKTAVPTGVNRTDYDLGHMFHVGMDSGAASPRISAPSPPATPRAPPIACPRTFPRTSSHESPTHLPRISHASPTHLPRISQEWAASTHAGSHPTGPRIR